MKPIILVIDKAGNKECFLHLKDFCTTYGIPKNTAYRWKFPKQHKKLGIFIEKITVN